MLPAKETFRIAYSICDNLLRIKINQNNVDDVRMNFVGLTKKLQFCLSVIDWKDDESLIEIFEETSLKRPQLSEFVEPFFHELRKVTNIPSGITTKVIEIEGNWGKQFRNYINARYEEYGKKKSWGYDEPPEIDPKWINTLELEGITLANLGRCEEAIACYDEVLKINPENVNVLLNKGDALINLNMYGEAIECFNMVLKIEPDKLRAVIGKSLCLKKIAKK